MGATEASIAVDPTITGPLDTGVNYMAGYIADALPYALAVMGILLGIGIAVRVFGRLQAYREDTIIAAHEASTSDLELWQDNYLYALGEGSSEAEALGFADSQLSGFTGFSDEQHDAYMERQYDKSDGI